MRFVDAAEVRRLLSFPVLIDALEAAHRRPKITVLDGMLGSEKELYFARSAVDAGRFMASKLITSFPANLEGGKLPAVQAVCVLFDGSRRPPARRHRRHRGHLLAHCGRLRAWRAAAGPARSADAAGGRRRADVALAGAFASHRAPLAEARADLEPHAGPRGEVAASLTQEGIPAEATTDLDGATRVADVITCCTRSHAPLVKGANLKPGTHLDLVGGYTPQTREADDEAARRSVIFVDRRESAFHGVGDILSPIASGAIKESDVQGDLYDLVPAKSPAAARPPTSPSSRTPAAATSTS